MRAQSVEFYLVMVNKVRSVRLKEGLVVCLFVCWWGMVRAGLQSVCWLAKPVVVGERRAIWEMEIVFVFFAFLCWLYLASGHNTRQIKIIFRFREAAAIIYRP